MYTTVKEGITDTYMWYVEHRDDGRSMDQEVAFLKKTIECLLDLSACTAQEFEKIKGTPKSPLLFTPNGVIFR